MTSPEEKAEEDAVLQDLRDLLKASEPKSLFDKSATAVPVAAIKTLLGVVQRSKAETIMGLQDELKRAADIMVKSFQDSTAGGRSHIALSSGCELFLKYITRTFLELPDFEECRQAILERGERFQLISLAARDRISAQAADFIPNNSTVLTHGWSRVVAGILMEAAKTKNFDLIILEGRPDAAGAKAAQFYSQDGKIPVRLVLDSAMGSVMEDVDLVLTGAEAVVENGGVVNKLGTYALACCAQASRKPFYVAAESYKFARLYPLRQSDLPDNPSEPFSFCDTTKTPEKMELNENIEVQNPSVDFTPSKFITLLFTDLGVLTPSAVSDELIRLYQ
uniref:Translation initiation factor eIF2B subunit alpha n=1 Tax=Amphora coffeiformis TaxID=265554 RepID=A0A7S3P834_9STRA|eukprot:scaffold3077_cov162-Amphora_coffeaeformis.AAC.42